MRIDEGRGDERTVQIHGDLSREAIHRSLLTHPGDLIAVDQKSCRPRGHRGVHVPAAVEGDPRFRRVGTRVGARVGAPRSARVWGFGHAPRMPVPFRPGRTDARRFAGVSQLHPEVTAGFGGNTWQPVQPRSPPAQAAMGGPAPVSGRLSNRAKTAGNASSNGG